MYSNPVVSLQDKEIPSDRELINTALRGEQCGFARLEKRYRARLLSAMQNHIQCAATVEDIVQDAFAKAFTHLASFREDSNFYTWLYRIALNQRRNYFRRHDTNVSLDSIVGTVQPATTEQRDSPDAVAQQDEVCVKVRQAMERLSAKDKAILVMREFEGLDYLTISANLKIRLGTVRSRLFRARRELRHQLEAHYSEMPRALHP